MSENTLISHSAPTLAGLKTANLFTCHCGKMSEAVATLRVWNGILNPKGVCVRILGFQNERLLVYVFRPEKLRKDLADPTARKLLKRYGYRHSDLDSCLRTLAKKIYSAGEFPHEVGLFLGYPPADVRSFIENKGQGSRCTGYWKVYGDIESARETFRRFSKCTRVYARCMKEGSTLERLTVASRSA